MEVWWLATSKNDGHCSYNELKYRKVLAQGWPEIGDISAFESILDKSAGANDVKFIELINQMVEFVYEGWNDTRNPGRILSNLIRFKEGDLVVCTEGREVKGIARVGKNPKYKFDDGSGLYNYAQTMYPVTEWKDWNNAIVGAPPESGTMGPIGITHVQKDAKVFIAAWEKLSS